MFFSIEVYEGANRKFRRVGVPLEQLESVMRELKRDFPKLTRIQCFHLA